MVNFTVDEIRMMMDRPRNIRNMSVIAHVDHGKSTLTDSLISAAGIIAQKAAGETRFMDTREDEQERTITIKSTAVTLFFEMDNNDIEVYDPESKKKALEELKKKKKAEAAAADAEGKGKKKKKAKDGEAAGDKEAKGKKKKAGAKDKEAEKDEDGEKEAAPAEKKNIQEMGDISATGKTGFLINLIDSPGHVDFSSEVTAALRVTDGALVVVDCIEGVCVQTETVLRQAIAERIKPVLWVNKLDRVFLELQMDLEEAYQNFVRAIESVNVVIATYLDDQLGDVQVYPEEGTVSFGSGIQSWGFSVGKFARLYATKLKIPEKKLMTKLWGDNYFDAKAKKWTKKNTAADGEKLNRAFVEFVLKPLETLVKAIMADKKEQYTTMMEKLSIKMPADAKENTGKALMKRVVQSWLPAGDTLLSMIVNHLPSPVVAQRYRCENLYSGPQDDDCARGIKSCDAKAPLMLYISKMVPTSEKGRFYAFGRVFSGTVATGQTVRIQGPDYQHGKKNDLYVKKIQRTVLMMGRYTEQLQDCPCGNIVGLVGIDQYLLKSGTITTSEEAHNFFDMKYSVSPVVRVSVQPKNAADLPKLMEGLKRLSKSDPLVQCFTAPTGEHIIAGAGELHLEICLKDLKDDFMKGAAIEVGRPVVSFNETVSIATPQDVISKSPNKHNRIFMRAEPLGEDLCKACDEKEITPDMDKKLRARKMADDFKWDIGDARKVWAFGCPPDGIPNVLVDMTKGVQGTAEIKDSMVTAFTQHTVGGILCEEALRGIRFNILDLTLHADSIHRGAGQIMPPTKRAMSACQIISGPSLLEPMYKVDITVPQNALAGVYATLNARRGVIEGKNDRVGTPITQVIAFLPVLESFGFTQLLRQNTSGQAFPQMIFHHWQPTNGSCYEAGSQAANICKEVRARKGLKEEMPDFNEYYDKL